jgi:hypothetical protein
MNGATLKIATLKNYLQYTVYAWTLSVQTLYSRLRSNYLLLCCKGTLAIGMVETPTAAKFKPLTVGWH